MKVKALRGVCVGIDKHLAADEIAALTDTGLVAFLVGIKAVELVKDEPPPAAAQPDPEPKPSKKPGKKE